MQVISQLITNSWTHGRPDGSQVQARVSACRDADQIRIRFEDDGVGIPVEYQEKVFEPIYTTAYAKGATGIGLHLVYNLVTHHMMGEISCSRSDMGGVLFDIRIPVGE